jgi:hypothetical protein
MAARCTDDHGRGEPDVEEDAFAHAPLDALALAQRLNGNP